MCDVSISMETDTCDSSHWAPHRSSVAPGITECLIGPDTSTSLSTPTKTIQELESTYTQKVLHVEDFVVKHLLLNACEQSKYVNMNMNIKLIRSRSGIIIFRGLDSSVVQEIQRFGDVAFNGTSQELMC